MTDIFDTEDLFLPDAEEDFPFYLMEESVFLAEEAAVGKIENHSLNQSFYESETVKNKSFYQQVCSNLLETKYEKSLTIAPQITVTLSAEEQNASHRLAEEIKAQICREIQTELGGYFSW